MEFLKSFNKQITLMYAVAHPGIFGILHLTYYVLGRTNSFSGLLNSIVVWVLDRRESFESQLDNNSDIRPEDRLLGIEFFKVKHHIMSQQTIWAGFDWTKKKVGERGSGLGNIAQYGAVGSPTSTHTSALLDHEGADGRDFHIKMLKTLKKFGHI